MSVFKSKSHEIRWPQSRKDSLVTLDNLSTAIRATEYKKSSVGSVRGNECTSEINDETNSSISFKTGIKNLRFKIEDEFQKEDSPKESVENETKVLNLDQGQMNYEGLQNPSKSPLEMSDLSNTKRQSDYEIRKELRKSLMEADISLHRISNTENGMLI